MKFSSVLLAFAVFFVYSSITFAVDEQAGGPVNPNYGKESDRQADVANPNVQNRVHRRSNMWMNITNWGFFGNYFINSVFDPPMDDPEYPGNYAPQCEFPGGSDIQYLYQGALWVGALVQQEGLEFPRVSVGTGGWFAPRG
ncbi:MAG: hypothetical protein H8E46_02905, partial [FCB group bacterium]|nr:hypothetical protein [FCB group bacterium]